MRLLMSETRDLPLQQKSPVPQLDERVTAASAALRALQRADGHWVFELEADTTIPAEYVLFVHYLGEQPDLELERKIGVYLRRQQMTDGGWPLFHAGAFDISASVKAYFALKMIGDDPSAEHMRKARAAILRHGGAASANVFTRILLALFGNLPWRAVPQMPVEIMLLPAWFPVHISKISYWGRTVLVPLLVLQALKPRARNSRGVRIDELFVAPPDKTGRQPKAPHQNRLWYEFFRVVDIALQVMEPHFPRATRQRAVDKAVAFVTERLNGEDGLGAIFPAMVNSVLMFDALGYAQDHPDRAIARQSIDKLLIVKDDEAYCQPCVSPVWDTALAAHALLESGTGKDIASAQRGFDWLLPLQELSVKGDWAFKRPNVRPGGWAFQYANPHYPDLDDTAVIVMGMQRAQKERDTPAFDPAIARAREWIEGLQSSDGGWGAFDADNTREYLNNIPFADHGALLDPPSPDLTGRCVSMLAQLGATVDNSPALRAGVEYLRRTQLPDGSWYGRWGVNYIYGTWSTLCALNAAGFAPDAPEMKRAAAWLISIQNEDGGWGEDCDSYKIDYRGHEAAASTASQTAWALLGLMAAGEARHPSVARGIDYLLATQDADGLWSEHLYTGTGFPRVFYLRYHGYPKFFPLWALARYRNLKNANSSHVTFGI
jgi:squalene-hopene/tetraprenyl-beta-curcumene cyclase